MRNVKILMLVLRDMWKHKWGYVLLIMELILVEILFLSFGSKVQGVFASSEVRNAFNDKNMVTVQDYRVPNKYICTK